MQLFRLAGRVVLRHRGLLALYVLMLAAFGLLMASYVGGGTASYEETRPTVAVIDRDGSEVSRALAGFVREVGTPVELPDTPYALQDAAAKDLATYVLVIPEGYGDAFVGAARGEGPMPALERSVSYQGAQGSLMDERVRAFAQQVYALIREAGAEPAEAVEWALEAQESRVEVDVTDALETGLPQDYLIYMQFSTYALFGGTAVLVACGLRSIGADRPVRARLRAAGIPDWACEAQMALACAAIGVAVWAAMGAIGALGCAGSLASADPRLLALAQVPLLALALVGAAFGYLLWGLGTVGDVAHAAGNVGSMVLTFLGGTWVSQASMDAAVTAVARFTPVWWVVHALGDVYAATEATGSLALSVVSQAGLVALFAVAIAAAGGALSKARSRG